MAKPDDDFIDITAPSGNPGSPAAQKPNEVDFDLGRSEPVTRAKAATEPVDYTKTMILRKPPVPTASADTDRAPDTAPSAARAAPQRAMPASASADDPPASGGSKLWLGIVVAVLVVVVVWWFMRR